MNAYTDWSFLEVFIAIEVGPSYVSLCPLAKSVLQCFLIFCTVRPDVQ